MYDHYRYRKYEGDQDLDAIDIGRHQPNVGC